MSDSEAQKAPTLPRCVVYYMGSTIAVGENPPSPGNSSTIIGLTTTNVQSNVAKGRIAVLRRRKHFVRRVCWAGTFAGGRYVTIRWHTVSPQKWKYSFPWGI